MVGLFQKTGRELHHFILCWKGRPLTVPAYLPNRKWLSWPGVRQVVGADRVSEIVIGL